MIEEQHSTTGRELVTERTFDAPRELVFRAWTEPEHLARWWGPTGFTITTQEMDVRPGGVWRFVMHGPDGTDYPHRATYVEVVPPERLVYWLADDVDENAMRFLATATFTEADGRTTVQMSSLFDTPEELEFVIREVRADEGAKQTLERLAELLATLTS